MINVIILLLLALCVVWAIRTLRRPQGHSCCGGCTGCDCARGSSACAHTTHCH